MHNLQPNSLTKQHIREKKHSLYIIFLRFILPYAFLQHISPQQYVDAAWTLSVRHLLLCQRIHPFNWGLRLAYVMLIDKRSAFT